MTESTPTSRKSIPINRLKIVLFLGLLICTGIGAAVILFVCIEFGVEIYDRKFPALNAPEEHLKRELAPYLQFQSEPNTVMKLQCPQPDGTLKPGEAHINRYRFRYGELTKEKPVGTIRIFLLGGSVVFNGCTNETTISGYLESMLNQRRSTTDRRYQVINAGMTGYISTQELILLITQALDFNPDGIIVFDGYNDCLIPLALDDRLNYPYGFKTIDAAWYQTSTVLKGMRELSLLSHLLCGSHLLRHLNPRWSYSEILGEYRLPKASDQAIEKATVPKTAELLLSNWRKMADILKTRTIHGLFVLQPLHFEIKEFTQFYDEIEQRLPQFREENKPGIFVSYRTYLRDRPQLFYDEIHTYDEGNSLYAEKLLTDLERMNFMQ